jgi:Las1-like
MKKTLLTMYHQVEAWKLRGHLPHAVEATALLTDAILHDDAERNSVFAIRATYAAAFSRYVLSCTSEGEKCLLFMLDSSPAW